MRFPSFALLCLVVLASGCTIRQSSASVHPRAALELDGRQRAVRVILDESIQDTQQTYGDNVSVTDWRYIVKKTWVDALAETFTVAAPSTEGVPTLRVMRATPRWVARGQTLFAQIDFVARLEVPGQGVTARVASVVEGPISVAGSGWDAATWKRLDEGLASAVELMVRSSSEKLLRGLAEQQAP